MDTDNSNMGTNNMGDNAQRPYPMAQPAQPSAASDANDAHDATDRNDVPQDDGMDNTWDGGASHCPPYGGGVPPLTPEELEWMKQRQEFSDRYWRARELRDAGERTTRPIYIYVSDKPVTHPGTPDDTGNGTGVAMPRHDVPVAGDPSAQAPSAQTPSDGPTPATQYPAISYPAPPMPVAPPVTQPVTPSPVTTRFDPRTGALLAPIAPTVQSAPAPYSDVSESSADSYPAPPLPTPTADQEETDVEKAYNGLAAKLLETMVGPDGTGDVIVSPLSAVMLLGIAADASQGPTRSEITRAIAPGTPYDELMRILHDVQARYTRSRTVRSANAVCVRNDYAPSIHPGYAERLRHVFGGALFSSIDLVNDVNAWAAKKTNGMIDRVADDSATDAVFCLLNAIAFESDWKTPYEDTDPTRREFHNADGTTSTVMMLPSSERRYLENQDVIGFTKPYKNERFEFMALLPKNPGNEALLDAVRHTDFTRTYRGQDSTLNKSSDDILYPIPHTAHVWLPEFSRDTWIDLIGFCRGLGIETVFGPGADFSPLTSAPIYIGEIVHKAHIEVDRRGTKAAAVTFGFAMVTGMPTAYPPVTEVHLDRPFLYAIMDSETGLPVFTGVCTSIPSIE